MPIVITERFAEAYTELPRHIQKKYASLAYDDQSLEYIESFAS